MLGSNLLKGKIAVKLTEKLLFATWIPFGFFDHKVQKKKEEELKKLGHDWVIKVKNLR